MGTFLDDVSEEEIICTNCNSPWVIKTHDGYWCKNCHNEM